jgi:hypothetical protein
VGKSKTVLNISEHKPPTGIIGGNAAATSKVKKPKKAPTSDGYLSMKKQQ